MKCTIAFHELSIDSFFVFEKLRLLGLFLEVSVLSFTGLVCVDLMSCQDFHNCVRKVSHWRVTSSARNWDPVLFQLRKRLGNLFCRIAFPQRFIMPNLTLSLLRRFDRFEVLALLIKTRAFRERFLFIFRTIYPAFVAKRLSPESPLTESKESSDVAA